MDDSRDTVMRLNSVRAVDPHVTEILESSKRTALYTYEHESESWTKTEVEGTLMIYRRSVPPYHMITINNRLTRCNFIEQVTGTCDLQVKPPYLLFRNTKGVIFGIWFSQLEDVDRIAQLISEKIRLEASGNAGNPIIMADPAIFVAPDVGGGGGGGDILGMLSRAHGEFEKRHEPRGIVGAATSVGGNVVKPSPMRAQTNGAPNIVADFLNNYSQPPLSAGAPRPHPVPPTGGVQTIPPGTSPAMLQKMFDGVSVAHASNATNVTPSQPVAIPPPRPNQNHVVAGHTASLPPGMSMSLQELEGRLRDDLRMASQRDDLREAVQPNQHELLAQAKPHAHYQPHVQQGGGEASLLSPQVFTSSRGSDIVSHTSVSSPINRTFPGLLTPGTCNFPDVRPLNGSLEDLHHDNHGSHHSVVQTPVVAKVTPLTKEQLVQALTHLLKKDDFVVQLHQAYVQVLNQSFKGTA